MTTCAWDGRYLACDSMANFSGQRMTVDKMFVMQEENIVVCGAGGLTDLLQYVKWVREGRDYSKWPFDMKEQETVVLELRKDGLFDCCYQIEIPIGLQAYAVGSGALAAKAAMLCGKNALEAVAIAAKVDLHTGGLIRHVDHWNVMNGNLGVR